MPEFLVRSGPLCAVVDADDTVDAFTKAVTECGDGLQLGSSTQIIALDACEAATTYQSTLGLLKIIGFEDQTPCGSPDVTTTGSRPN